MLQPPRIVIGVPHVQGMVHVALLRSMMQLDLGGLEVMVIDSARASSEAITRNLLVQKFLEHPGKATHILFVDSNLSMPPHTVKTLLHADRDIVCGLAVEHVTCRLLASNVGKSAFRPRQLHYDWCVPPGPGQPHWLLKPELENKLLPLDVGSVACLMIRRAVIEKLPYPWFFDRFDPTATGHGDDSVLDDGTAFFLAAKEHGFQAHVHTGVLCQRWSGNAAFPPFWKRPQTVEA